MILTRGAYALPGTSLAYKTGTWRLQRPVHRHRAAPCHAACPAGEDAQAWLARLDEGDPQGAWESLVSANPLPAITGRVCHHPCERACNRGQFDQPIAIHAVERFLGDQALANDWPYPVSPPSPAAPEIAVVGAGPAGLSCAYHLLRLGYRARMFDALPEAGGTLRTALPPYRLPRGVLEAEIGRLLNLGIGFEPGVRLGRDVYLDDLRRQYPAVFLALGATRPRPWDVAGAVPAELHQGLELLKEWVSVGELPKADSVAVVGGGNTSVDIARVMRRIGVPEVHLITHRALPHPDVPEDDWMPAIPREVEQAQEEGVVFHPHTGVRRLVLRGQQLLGIELVKMKKLVQSDGSLKRVPFEGTEKVLPIEQVIPAIGEVVDPSGLESLLGGQEFLRVDAWGRVAGISGVFAGGDMRFGAGMVSIAIGDGRRAALAIAAYLQGKEPEAEPVKTIAYEQLNVNYYDHAPRAEPTLLPVAQRVGFAEVEGGLDTAQAAAEAARCFSCGSCLSCDNCWNLCPEPAVLKLPDEIPSQVRYVFDYDYCKGCGLCARECPCGFIVMEDEA